jgi:hypothetical protein
MADAAGYQGMLVVTCAGRRETGGTHESAVADQRPREDPDPMISGLDRHDREEFSHLSG